MDILLNKDIIIAVIPALLVAFISWLSLSNSYKRSRLDKKNDFQIEKLENLYKKLLAINSELIICVRNYREKDEYFLDDRKKHKIFENIHQLNLETKLFLNISKISDFEEKSDNLLRSIESSNNSNKENLRDEETEEIEKGEIICIIPSTFDQIYQKYEDSFHDLETKVIKASEHYKYMTFIEKAIALSKRNKSRKARKARIKKMKKQRRRRSMSSI